MAFGMSITVGNEVIARNEKEKCGRSTERAEHATLEERDMNRKLYKQALLGETTLVKSKRNIASNGHDERMLIMSN